MLFKLFFNGITPGQRRYSPGTRLLRAREDKSVDTLLPRQEDSPEGSEHTRVVTRVNKDACILGCSNKSHTPLSHRYDGEHSLLRREGFEHAPPNARKKKEEEDPLPRPKRRHMLQCSP